MSRDTAQSASMSFSAFRMPAQLLLAPRRWARTCWSMPKAIPSSLTPNPPQFLSSQSEHKDFLRRVQSQLERQGELLKQVCRMRSLDPSQLP